MMTLSDSFLLLDNIGATSPDTPPDTPSALLFSGPTEVITTSDPAAIPEAFARMEAALEAGHHLAGWLSYELGYHFEDSLRSLAPLPSASSDLPLLWMAAFPAPAPLTPSELAEKLDPIRMSPEAAHIHGITPGISRESYLEAIDKIRDYLHAGDIYQVNYTFPLTFTLDGTPRALYRTLRRGQPVPYAAWLHEPDRDVISLSPELFLDKRGPNITARPMKGTSPRGRTPEDDDENAALLASDPKQRAENVMIVDLLRNDLSRLATQGSVEVPDLFHVERYRSLLQMTSTVTAQIDPDLPLLKLFQSLFPCGSITGAPKIRAMEIIRELEPAPRGIYTGAIGYITPSRDLCFNVPIRTLTLTRENSNNNWQGRLGIGSGIVADSHPAEEYEECLLKGRFLTAPLPDFDLIETFAWEPGTGYRHLDSHLKRLRGSARFFAFPFDEAKIIHALTELATTFDPSPMRVRLLLGTTGSLCATATLLPKPFVNPRIVLSEHRIETGMPLLYHKTSARSLYTAALKAARAQGPFIETILQNERGELTEGSYSTLFLEKDGELLTPPLSAGLLPGILRAELLASGRAREATLYPQDLKTADRLYIGNSLRGLVEVTL